MACLICIHDETNVYEIIYPAISYGTVLDLSNGWIAGNFSFNCFLEQGNAPRLCFVLIFLKLNKEKLKKKCINEYKITLICVFYVCLKFIFFQLEFS